jgi:hypothetical protein
MPLFPTHCNFGGCHLGRETTGQMQLGDSCTYDLRLGTCTVDPSSLAPDVAATVHSNLLATSNAAPKLPRVTPGDVTRSFILMKLSGCQDAFPELTGCTYCGQFMPPGEPLRESDPALFELIARWIADGAKLD